MTEKTFSYLVDKSGHLIGYTETAAKGGEIVSYGEWLPEQGVFHEIGRAKISRDKKHEPNFRLLNDGETACRYDVNYGGGETI